ncbi:RagB/SusD family nutrient uptake outer membrane protein, partial [Streptococcus pyogenes]
HPSWGGANEDKDFTGYQTYKGSNPDTKQHETGKGTQGTIYFRYAEVLLNYIEAKAELGIATQDDVNKTINLIRSRVGMPNLDITN